MNRLFLKKISAVLLSLALVLGNIVPALGIVTGVASAEGPFSLGQVTDKWTTSVTQSVYQTKIELNSARGPQKIYVMDVDPSDPTIKLEAGMSRGKVVGMQATSQQAKEISRPGHIVVGGVNGDFYNTQNGEPVHIMIRDGKILKSPLNRSAVGFTKSNKVIIGVPKLTVTMNVYGQSTTGISGINTSRGENSLVLYTPEYAASTFTNSFGVETVLEDVYGDWGKDQPMRLVVKEVQKEVGNAALSDNTFVLSAHGNKRGWIESLEPGQVVEVTTKLDSPWDEVTEAIGGYHVLVKNGSLVNSTDASVHPRTAVGVRADGTAIFLVVDGRQPGFSEGVTLNELGSLMHEMGAVEAINLDGGGSSTFVARKPGDSQVSLINSPSDMGERSVANSLLVISSAPEGSLSRLAVLPDRMTILAGSTTTLLAKGQDEAYHPAAITGQVSWSADEAIGTIEEGGKFTAGAAAAKGKITATFENAAGEAHINVVDQLTKLTFLQSQMTVVPGSSQKLLFRGEVNGKSVVIDPKVLTFEVMNGIGTVDQAGTFTAVDATTVGSIKVSYKGMSSTIQVDVGKAPIILADFETGTTSGWGVTGARFNSIKREIAIEPEPVRFGNHSMRIEYDFTGQKGTSGVYLSKTGYQVIEGYPEKIGMWFYGDGAGHWLRAQLRDGNNKTIPIDFTPEKPGVDWVGWKYVEATVPKGKVTPLKLDLPVRYMSLNDEKKNKGVVYIDNIRAVYGQTNDDLTNPMLSDAFPENGGNIDSNHPTISILAEDNQGGSGVDPAQIKMKVDGVSVSPSFHEPTGKITYTPEETLSDGYHEVWVSIKDRFGNPNETKWSFNVSTGAPKFVYNGPQSVDAGSEFTLYLNLEKMGQLQEARASLAFNPSILQVVDVGVGSKLTESQFTTRTVNNATGKIELEAIDLNEVADLNSVENLAAIKFKANTNADGDIKIHFENGLIQLAGEERRVPVYLLPFEAVVAQPYELTVAGLAQGTLTTLTVKDQSGQPVEGASIRVLEPAAWSDDLGLTNEQGQIVTDKLTKTQITYKLQAVKDELVSKVMTVKVVPQLGDKKPRHLVQSMKNDPKTTRAITWNTRPDVEGTVLEYVPVDEFTSFEASHVQQVQGTSSLLPNAIGEMRVHVAEATQLKPGTIYTYRVGDGTADGWSDPSTFETEAAKSSPFTFLVAGDSQAGTQAGFNIYRDTMRAAMQKHPDAKFIKHIGDIVDDGNLLQQWIMFFNAAQETSSNLPFVPVLGNHDVYGEGAKLFASFIQNPENGPAGEMENVYSFDYGDVHFAMLNSEVGGDGLRKQAEWLRADMEKSTKKWKVVMFHRAPYHSNPLRGADATRNIFAPVIEELGVDLVLVGHDHAYARTYPMKGGKNVAPGEGTVYVIAGSTGPKFYPATKYSYIDALFDEDTQMFTAITVDGNELKLEATTIDGRVVDTHSLFKADRNAEISLNGPQIVMENDQFELAIQLKNMKDVYGASIKLEYDPSQLQVVDADPDTEGIQIIPGDILGEAQIQNDTNQGIIKYTVTKVREVPGTDGEGILAKVPFKVLRGTGGQTVQVRPLAAEMVLVNSQNQPVPVDAVAYEGRVSGKTVTHEVNGSMALPSTHHLADKSGLEVVVKSNGQVVAQTETNAAGEYAFTLTAPGEYTIEVSANGYKTAMVAFSASEEQSVVTIPALTLYVGDFNGDGLINIVDISQMAKAYEKEPTGPNYVYDVNRDLKIDLYDVVTVARNFNK
ncbi:phosphodiester glycosidase family protein [Ammoniphilus sp. CFH 90114]|uniref:phosphodiester glycosidase family protein n=1 Tax=Ammoniphilus sp. CFH 90114 TaxID=2493665 RepID=UPI0013E97438|nr:phosphodiester glycosidase family protein [Ammoniphilus sp. CFH 90114]